MTSQKLYKLLVLSLCVVIALLIGGTYFFKSFLEKQSESIVSKRAEVIKLEQEQTSLVRAKKDIQTYKPLASIAEDIVPQDKDQAETVREIVKIASENDISLGSITFPTSTLGESTAPKTGNSSTSTGVTAKPGLSQLTPVKGVPGVYSLQIIVTSDAQKPISYAKLTKFLDQLENNRRTALVSNISINPDKKNRSAIAFTLTLDEYIRP
jgi:hypothetical protein